jgi:hypothetical protein
METPSLQNDPQIVALKRDIAAAPTRLPQAMDYSYSCVFLPVIKVKTLIIQINQVLYSLDHCMGMLKPQMFFNRLSCLINSVRCFTERPTWPCDPSLLLINCASQGGNPLIKPTSRIVTIDHAECTTFSRNGPTGATTELF